MIAGYIATFSLGVSGVHARNDTSVFSDRISPHVWLVKILRGCIIAVMTILLACAQGALLVVWIYSSYRPRLQQQLLRRYPFHTAYALGLLVFFWHANRDPLFTHDQFAWLLFLAITSVFLLGELSIEKKSGWWN